MIIKFSSQGNRDFFLNKISELQRGTWKGGTGDGREEQEMSIWSMSRAQLLGFSLAAEVYQFKLHRFPPFNVAKSVSYENFHMLRTADSL